MSHSVKLITDGYIKIMSDEGEALYNSLQESHLFFEQLSVIFNEYAILKDRDAELATKSDIQSLKEMVARLSEKITLSTGEPKFINSAANNANGNSSGFTVGIPPISFGTSMGESIPEEGVGEPKRAPVINKTKKQVRSLEDMLNISRKQG